MDIVSATDEHQGRWDSFVHSHAEGWHYNRFGWKQVIEQTYGLECPYLIATDSDAVVGLLPLTVVKSRLFGRSVTSLPYLDTAGILTADPLVQSALIAKALEIARNRGVDYLELRQAEQVPSDCRVDTHKVSLTLPMQQTVEEQWDALPSERRNRIRKARKAGLSGVVAGTERLGDFYRVWSHNMRDLGSPAHSQALFENVLRVFGDSTRLLLIEHQERCVGAAVMVEYKQKLAVPWVSSLRESFALHPNDFLYWEAIKTAVEHGCLQFDFGRSTAKSGNHTYKKRWGAIDAPMYWQYYSVGEGEPRLSTGDASRAFKMAVSVWQKIPVTVANYIGPTMRKSITS